LASELEDSQAKAASLKIADEYDGLAVRAAERSGMQTGLAEADRLDNRDAHR
jgi:hypothetical protein